MAKGYVALAHVNSSEYSQRVNPNGKGAQYKSEAWRLMPDYELISPFPEAELPSLWRWIQPYADKTEYARTSAEDFVVEKRMHEKFNTSWGIRYRGEFGGYMDFEFFGAYGGDPRPNFGGTATVLCKPYFFRMLRQSVVLPALREALSLIFDAQVSVVLFTPLEQNGLMINLLKTLGARDACQIAANGVPEKRVLAIGSGDWEEINNIGARMGRSARQKHDEIAARYGL